MVMCASNPDKSKIEIMRPGTGIYIYLHNKKYLSFLFFRYKNWRKSFLGRKLIKIPRR